MWPPTIVSGEIKDIMRIILKVRFDRHVFKNQCRAVRQLSISNNKVNKAVVVILSAALAACSTPSGLSSKDLASNIKQKLPIKWQLAQDGSLSQSKLDNWLESFADPALTNTAQYALSHNYQLKVQYYNVELAKERLQISKSANFPEASLTIDNARRKQVSASNVSYQNSASISVDLRYELDLWGKISDEQKQNRLNLSAAQADYKHAQLALVSNISQAWFNLIEAKQLLNLYQERADNLKRNLAMIDSSYKLGLNDALDVYLTKNTVNQELARVAQQQQTVVAQSRALEVLLGDYPKGEVTSSQTLSFIDEEINVGIPAHLLTRRHDLQASWLELLALDAGLAVAHKQRFPSFNLNANVSDSDNELAELLSKGSLAWSLIGSISSPIFNAGRLESQAQQAKLAVKQKEQQYLQQVYQALADVENSVSERRSLTERYHYFVKAQENALAAEKLSFEQYLRGLVTYTTVLESQRRSFDAQTTVIQLRNQLLQNRITIYSALGGEYLTTPLSEQSHNSEKPMSSYSLNSSTRMEK